MKYFWMILNFLFGSNAVDSDTPTTDTPPADQPTAGTGDAMLDAFIVLFDDAEALCTFDWTRRQIEKLEGAFVEHWPAIRAGVHDFTAEGVDAALKALWVVLAGHPIAQKFVNVARGFILSKWDALFAKARPKLAKMGIKLAA